MPAAAFSFFLAHAAPVSVRHPARRGFGRAGGVRVASHLDRRWGDAVGRNHHPVRAGEFERDGELSNRGVEWRDLHRHRNSHRSCNQAHGLKHLRFNLVRGDSRIRDDTIEVQFDRIRARRDVAIDCTAHLIDRREVTSSNGEREERYVIATEIVIAGRHWPIEITLADRNMMTYRMLLGRQAIQAGMLVDPSSSFLQPKLHYSVYERNRR